MTVRRTYPQRLVCYWERGWSDHQDVVALSAEGVEAEWKNARVPDPASCDAPLWAELSSQANSLH
jgi:hypothetical protein